ncbi:hypothetical protein N0V85_009522 [Neurospora sp. IMI 360204]|nr:hypothetical protein N0V85_009522 [Neurospora sp. IMI 360204]
MDRDNKANESDEESSHKSSQKPSPRRPPILRLKSMVAPPTYWYIDEKDNESHFGEGKLPRSTKEKGKGIDYRLYHEDSIFKIHRRERIYEELEDEELKDYDERTDTDVDTDTDEDTDEDIDEDTEDNSAAEVVEEPIQGPSNPRKRRRSPSDSEPIHRRYYF